MQLVRLIYHDMEHQKLSTWSDILYVVQENSKLTIGARHT
jgi:hypothetical protein